jgi:hypothetical protein
LLKIMLASYGLCYMIHGKTVARYSHPDFDMTRHAQGDGCIGWLEELCDVCAVLVTGGTHANRIVRPIVRETNEVKKGARPSFSTHQEESNELLFGPLRVRRGRKVTRGRSSDLRTEHTCRLVGGVGGPWPLTKVDDAERKRQGRAASPPERGRRSERTP